MTLVAVRIRGGVLSYLFKKILTHQIPNKSVGEVSQFLRDVRELIFMICDMSRTVLIIMLCDMLQTLIVCLCDTSYRQVKWSCCVACHADRFNSHAV